MKSIPSNAASDYLRQGFVILPQILDEEELAVLERSCDTLLAEPPDDDMGGKAHDIGKGHDRRFLRHRHEDLPELGAFLLGEDMKELSSTFVGETPHLFNEQFVVKGPKTGASFAWHQDSAYVGFDHEPYVTIWIAVDDTTVDNGAVYVLPRNLNDDMSIVPHEWDLDGKEMVGYDGPDPGIPAEVPRGSIVAFSSVTLHRSSTNITEKPRRGFVAQYSAAPLLDPKTQKPKTFAKPL